MEARHDAKRRIAHRLEHAIIGQVAGRNDLDPSLGETAFLVTADEGDGLTTRRKEHEDRLRVGVAGALNERREFGVLKRHAHRADNFATGGGERFDESTFGINTGSEVGHEDEHTLDAAFGRPLRHRLRVLRQRMRDAHDIRRARGDDGSRRVHDHHRLFRLGGNRRHGERVGRQAEPGEDVHLVARDQFLCQALGDVGSRAGRIADHDLDLLSGVDLAVQLEVRLHAADDLRAVIGEWAGKFGHHADLDRTLRERRACA